MTPEEHIDAAIAGIFQAAAGEMVSELRDTLDTSYPPASSPGESPHLRSGVLQAGITSSIEQSGPLTILTIVSTAPYSAYLENGTTRMEARPFMGPLRDEWNPVIYQRLSAAFTGPAILAAD